MTQYKRTSKRNRPDEREEPPAFVPRHIALQFMAIKGVTDVKPYMSTSERIEIILLVNQSYNHDLHAKILQVEWGIKETLRSRQQKFQASISW